MKIKCPFCQESFNLEDYLRDSLWVQVIRLQPEFGAHSGLVFEYAQLFKIGPPINVRKLLRILQEVLEVWKAGAFDFQKRRYEISREGLAAALRTVCNQQIKGGLNNHNYLKKVAIGIAEEEARKRSKDEEHKFRDREAALGGEREKRVGDMPGKIKEFLKNIG